MAEVGAGITDEYLRVIKKMGYEYTGEKTSPLVKVSEVVFYFLHDDSKKTSC